MFPFLLSKVVFQSFRDHIGLGQVFLFDIFFLFFLGEFVLFILIDGVAVSLMEGVVHFLAFLTAVPHFFASEAPFQLYFVALKVFIEGLLKLPFALVAIGTLIFGILDLTARLFDIFPTVIEVIDMASIFVMAEPQNH